MRIRDGAEDNPLAGTLAGARERAAPGLSPRHRAQVPGSCRQKEAAPGPPPLAEPALSRWRNGPARAPQCGQLCVLLPSSLDVSK